MAPSSDERSNNNRKRGPEHPPHIVPSNSTKRISVLAPPSIHHVPEDQQQQPSGSATLSPASLSGETEPAVSKSSSCEEANESRLEKGEKEDVTSLKGSGSSSADDEEQTGDKTSSDYYFDSYAHHAIHEEMLKDEVRTKTYQMAILNNKHLFQDKIVLDVGCGTGILSMFAAQAGAKHVYAVDSSTILWQAKKIVEKNGFAEKITCIKGKIEEIDLPVEQVDIIVSEWMGYMLLYESMLETVIYARDKWLVPNGIVFPDKAVLYVAALEDGNVKNERFNFWESVYGFDMTSIKEVAMSEPVVDVVSANAVVTTSVPILHLDILTCTKNDLEFTSKFQLRAERNDYIHGLVTYFECAFTQIHKPIGFSTAPFAKYTHWKQTILYLDETITICAGESCSGEITCKPNKKNRRDLDIGLRLAFKGSYSEYDKEVHFRLR